MTICVDFEGLNFFGRGKAVRVYCSMVTCLSWPKIVLRTARGAK